LIVARVGGVEPLVDPGREHRAAHASEAADDPEEDRGPPEVSDEREPHDARDQQHVDDGQQLRHMAVTLQMPAAPNVGECGDAEHQSHTVEDPEPHDRLEVAERGQSDATEELEIGQAIPALGRGPVEHSRRQDQQQHVMRADLSDRVPQRDAHRVSELRPGVPGGAPGLRHPNRERQAQGGVSEAADEDREPERDRRERHASGDPDQRAAVEELLAPDVKGSRRVLTHLIGEPGYVRATHECRRHAVEDL
jgi:hypothetical protein